MTTDDDSVFHAVLHGINDGLLEYTCSCDGCWACEGHVAGCTCDVDWDKLHEQQRDREASQ